jgi:hypothetical protein
MLVGAGASRFAAETGFPHCDLLTDKARDKWRERLRQFWASVRRGTLGAIQYGALLVPGIVSAQAVEVTTQGGTPARLVMLYISDSSGVASEAMAEAVRAALLDYRAAGIQVIVATSIPQIVAVQLKLAFQSGVDSAGLTDIIRNSMVEFINSLPVSGTLYRGQLFSMLQRYVVDGLIVNEDSIVSPTGDLVPNAGMTLRTTLDQVTVV